MRVLVVGINPAESDDRRRTNTAWNRLQRWIDELGIRDCFRFTNLILSPGAYSKDMVDYRNLREDLINSDAVLCLGNFSYDVVRRYTLLPSRVYRLPHPSYRNRNLNDPEYERKVLAECKEWLNRKSTLSTGPTRDQQQSRPKGTRAAQL